MLNTRSIFFTETKMPHFEIDPEIRKAYTLPSEFYTDQHYFDLSKETVFCRSWQFAGHVSSHDDLTPFTLLAGSLDEPLLLVRTESELRCLSNVCTHRGMLLVEKPCKANLIKCGYHGRRFSLEGKFLSMPEFEAAENFPESRDDLPTIECSVSGDFVFVSLDPAAAFQEYINGGDAILNEIADLKLKLHETREYEVNAHWALYCENYLEGFHIPYVHRSLNEAVDYGTYTTEIFRYSSLQTGYAENGEVAGRYLFIFPNMMFNIYPWGVSVNVVRPVSMSKSVIEYLTYVGDSSKLGTGAGADLHGVELEDEAVVESVQQGIRSRFYDRGRYSPTREQGTHHFHRLIAEFLN